MALSTSIRHWLPIVTRCPVNGLPDVLWARVDIDGFEELYALRRALFSGFFMRKMFMEDVAQEIWARAAVLCGGRVRMVRVDLGFQRHVVTVSGGAG